MTGYKNHNNDGKSMNKCELKTEMMYKSKDKTIF